MTNWGIPSTTNLGRFQYTGQIWLPELGVYYYKARLYSPTLGRFMQTDPIGYEDGMNMYAYARNDPMNGRDPTGLAVSSVPSCATRIGCTSVVLDTSGTNGAAQGTQNAAAQNSNGNGSGGEGQGTGRGLGDNGGPPMDDEAKKVGGAIRALRSGGLCLLTGNLCGLAEMQGPSKDPLGEGLKNATDETLESNLIRQYRIEGSLAKFESNLIRNGYSRTFSKDGKAKIFRLDSFTITTRASNSSQTGMKVDVRSPSTGLERWRFTLP